MSYDVATLVAERQRLIQLRDALEDAPVVLRVEYWQWWVYDDAQEVEAQRTRIEPHRDRLSDALNGYLQFGGDDAAKTINLLFSLADRGDAVDRRKGVHAPNLDKRLDELDRIIKSMQRRDIAMARAAAPVPAGYASVREFRYAILTLREERQRLEDTKKAIETVLNPRIISSVRDEVRYLNVLEQKAKASRERWDRAAAVVPHEQRHILSEIIEFAETHLTAGPNPPRLPMEQFAARIPDVEAQIAALNESIPSGAELDVEPVQHRSTHMAGRSFTHPLDILPVKAISRPLHGRTL